MRFNLLSTFHLQILPPFSRLSFYFAVVISFAVQNFKFNIFTYWLKFQYIPFTYILGMITGELGSIGQSWGALCDLSAEARAGTDRHDISLNKQPGVNRIRMGYSGGRVAGWWELRLWGQANWFRSWLYSLQDEYPSLRLSSIICTRVLLHLFLKQLMRWPKDMLSSGTGK